MDFVSVKIDWYQSTFIFHLSIIIVTYFISAYSKNFVIAIGRVNKHKVYFWQVAVFAILVLVKGLSTTGRDIRGGYYFNFLSAGSFEKFRDKSIEIGYQALNVLVHNIFNNSYRVFIFIVALLTIIPVIRSISNYQSQIDISTAILLYTTCFFINGFSLLRIYLSASLLLISFDAIVDNRPVKSFAWIIIAGCFHVTALVFLIPYIIIMFKKINNCIIAVGLIILFAFIYLERDYIFTLLSSGNARYNEYSYVSTVKFGFEQIIYYAPLYVLWFLGRTTDVNKNFNKISFVFLSTGFFFGMLGYVIPIFGRIQSLFLPNIIIAAYYCKRCKIRFVKNRYLIDLLCAVYGIARFIIYITQYYNIDDVMPYSTVFNTVI